MILGIGLSGKASADEARGLLALMGVPARIPVAVPDFRASHPAVEALRRAGHPLVTLPVERLRGILTPSQSARILALYGTGCLAEACALCAAGEDARITIPRSVSPQGRVTAAVAAAPTPISRQGARS